MSVSCHNEAREESIGEYTVIEMPIVARRSAIRQALSECDWLCQPTLLHRQLELMSVALPIFLSLYSILKSDGKGDVNIVFL